MAVQDTLSLNALSTYLGRTAGERVLDGQIRRGDGETIKAAIVIGDMRNSTHLAEDLGRQAYIECLNVFFDNVAGAFDDAGGEILSFMGDGFLAIFPSGNTPQGRKEACRTAHVAAVTAAQRMNEANRTRAGDGLTEIGYGIGLHIGSVMFGNVGLEDRLTFSVFGSAVNEASRLETLTKAYNAPIIASEEFRGRCEGAWEKIGNETLKGVKGRLDVVGERNGGLAVVDYAHKPEALSAALEALRPLATGRLICVFGCGGDRDQGKRQIMGRIAVEKADVTLVTDDNPRSERPAAIRAEILAGAQGAREIGDRAQAIRAAVAMMGPGDVLLVAGKGHETGQIVGDRVIPFSDHEALRDALERA